MSDNEEEKQKGLSAQELPQLPTGAEAEAAPARKIQKLDKQIAKTKLDTDAFRSVVETSNTVKEAKLQEQIENAVPEEIKPFQAIEKYCQAAPCGSQWDPNATTKKFQICNQCQLHVYDFTKMDMPDIKNLVFSREGKENPKFYRRADGKFLTSECPAGQKRRSQNYAMAGVVIMLMLGLFLLTTVAQTNLPSIAPQATGSSRSNSSPSASSALSTIPTATNSPGRNPGSDTTTQSTIMSSPATIVAPDAYPAKVKKKDYDPTEIYRHVVLTQ